MHYAAQILLFPVTPELFRHSVADITLPGPLEHHPTLGQKWVTHSPSRSEHVRWCEEIAIAGCIYPKHLHFLRDKTLCERIFGRGRTMCMILWTCLIAAQELSSYLTREDKSFTPLVCWTTQLIQYVPIHNKNSVTSRQCLKICTSSMQTCLEPNYNIGHKWLQPRE